MISQLNTVITLFKVLNNDALFKKHKKGAKREVRAFFHLPWLIDFIFDRFFSNRS